MGHHINDQGQFQSDKFDATGKTLQQIFDALGADSEPYLKDRRVLYNAGHPGAEDEWGVVTSVGHRCVFVRFRGTQGQPCDPADLRFEVQL